MAYSFPIYIQIFNNLLILHVGMYSAPGSQSSIETAILGVVSEVLALEQKTLHPGFLSTMACLIASEQFSLSIPER